MAKPGVRPVFPKRSSDSAPALLRAALLALIVLTFSPRAAHAQEGITLSALTIELWPEYDQPTTLVILRGTLAPSVRLPATLTLHIPASSGGPHAVASQSASGQLLNMEFKTAPSGEQIAVELTTTTASFQVEYYDPGLTIAGEAREYAFEWTTDYPVSAATLRVQEPVEARGLTAEPAVTLAGSSDLGLNYYTTALGQVAAGQSVAVKLRYAKSTSTLSVEKVNQTVPAAQSVAAPVSAPTQAQPAFGLDMSMRYVLAGGLVLLSLGMVAWGVIIWRRGQSGASPPQRRNRPRAMPSDTPSLSLTLPSTPQAADGLMPFCAQCGQRAITGDRFCRNCGAKLREAGRTT